MSYVEREGVRFYFERTGDGPPLVLLSPLGWTAEHWHLFQVPYFAGRYEVITFDYRGTGRSDRPEGSYSTRRLAHDVIDLLEEIDLVEPVFMLGHSSGGGVLQWICIDQPEAVRAAVLVASGPGRIDDRPVARSFTPELVAALVEQGWPGFLENYLRGREMFVEADCGDVENFVAAHGGERGTDLLSWLRHMKAGLEHETLAHLGEIEMPCFVLVGDRDDVAPPGTANRIETSLELAKQLFYAEYVEIEDAALALHIEQPAAFNESVADFLVRH